jgi:starch synthase
MTRQEMTVPSRSGRWPTAPEPPLALEGSAADPVGVVHLVAEYAPYARTGGLAEAVAGLAKWQARSGLPVAVILPLYRAVRRTAPTLMPVGRPMTLEFGPRTERFRLLRIPPSPGVPRVFFIEHDGYFDRGGLYGAGGTDFGDNGMRFAFLACAALAALPRVSRLPLVLHAHDWHAALAPVYLRTRFAGDEYYDAVRSVLSVHNAAFHGHFPPEILRVIGLPDALYDWRFLEWYGRVNFLKGGMAFADAVATVSATHAAELCTPIGGFGLQGAFQALGDRLVGITNGIDQTLWDPEHDAHLPATYWIADLSGKRRCKASVQRAFGLPQHQDVPLVGMTARLVTQKGLDLVVGNADLVTTGAQFIFSGRGEARIESALTDLAAHSHQRVGVKLQFSERLAHRLMAGSDFFLVPSLYEPCGLTQMEAQRMGTIPIVRRVGGLVDTVEDGATGFFFNRFDPHALVLAVRRAIAAYRDQLRWEAMVREAMVRDFSWAPSAAAYSALYRRAQAGVAAER